MNCVGTFGSEAYATGAEPQHLLSRSESTSTAPVMPLRASSAHELITLKTLFVKMTEGQKNVTVASGILDMSWLDPENLCDPNGASYAATRFPVMITPDKLYDPNSIAAAAVRFGGLFDKKQFVIRIAQYRRSNFAHAVLCQHGIKNTLVTASQNTEVYSLLDPEYDEYVEASKNDVHEYEKRLHSALGHTRLPKGGPKPAAESAQAQTGSAEAEPSEAQAAQSIQAMAAQSSQAQAQSSQAMAAQSSQAQAANAVTSIRTTKHRKHAGAHKQTESTKQRRPNYTYMEDPFEDDEEVQGLNTTLYSNNYKAYALLR